jgi:ribonuclease HII
MTNTQPIIIGADEVGLGCVFGPLTVGAVANVDGWFDKEVRDSKKIKSERKMKNIASRIAQNTMWSLAWAPNTVIDEFGLSLALQSAYIKVLEGLLVRLQKANRPIEIMLDGSEMKKVTDWCGRQGVKVTTQVRADSLVFEVSAASIVAKASRDTWVHEAVKTNPSLGVYDLDSCKGYASEKHTVAIMQHGLSAWHRKNACANLVKRKGMKHAIAAAAV